MPTDLLARQPIDLLAGAEDRSVVSLRRGRPDTMWESFQSHFGADAEMEKAKAANALTYSEMLNITPSTAYKYHDEISQQVKDKLSTEKIITEKKGLGEAVSSGIDTSILGMMRKQKVPDIFESVDQLERWAHGFAAMGLDLPFFMAGYALGGGQISGWAGAFALPAGIRQMLVDKYTKGEVKDFKDFSERTINAAKETVKGQIVGGFTGIAGAVSPLGYKAFSELATMTVAGRLIEKQIPTARDFVDNAALLIMMHAGIKGVELSKVRIYEIKSSLQKSFSKDGIHPKEVADTIINKPIQELQGDISLVIDNTIADIKSKQPPPEPASTTTGKTELKVAEKQLWEMTPEEFANQHGLKAEIHGDATGGEWKGPDTISISNNRTMGKVNAGDWTGKDSPDFVSVKEYPENIRSAAHETAHGLFTKDPVKAHVALKELQAAGVPKDVAFESLVDSGGLYLLEPGAITNPKVKSILDKWLGKPTKTPPEETGITGIKNIQVDIERGAKGAEQIETPVSTRPPNWKELVKERVDSGEVDPRSMAERINKSVEFGEKPPSDTLTDEANIALLYSKKKLQNEHRAVENDIELASKEGRSIYDLEQRRDVLEAYIDSNERATKAIGTEQGRALQSRQEMMAEDYSFSSMIQRAKAEGITVTPEVREKFKVLSKKIEKAQQSVEGLDIQASKDNTDKTIKILRNEEGLRQRKEKRSYTKEEIDVEFDSLIKEFNKKVGGQLNVGIDPMAVKIMIDLARNRIRKGIVTAEGIVDEIYIAIKNVGIEYSKRDIRDTISGYGITKEMSKEEVSVALREAKRQMQLISALEDAKAAEVPLRTGLQRDKVSDRVRELQKEVTLAMRESGIEKGKTPEAQWKTSLDAVKTRLKNNIADLVKRMETGKAEPKKVGIKYDEAAASLKILRDKIQDVLDFAEGKKEKTPQPPEQRIRAATVAVEKSIAEYERRIIEEDLSTKKKTRTTPETPELKVLRQERDLLKDIYKMMKEEASPKKSPEEISLQAFRKRAENQIINLTKRLQEEDFTAKEKKAPLELGETELKLKFELDQLKKEYAKAHLEYLLENRGIFTKVKDSVVESMNLIKAIKSSWDVSAPGRQGFFYLLSHPVMGFKSLPEMFRALGSEEAAFRIENTIRERPNAKSGKYESAGLSLTERGGGKKAEEIYKSRWAEIVPGIPASERAFTSFLNLARVDLFDFLHDNNFTKAGKKATDIELKALGTYANEATGRGTIKGYENAVQGLGTFLWAPKLVLSRFQILLGHGMWGGTATTRTAVAKEYARILGSLTIIYTVNDFLGFAEVEWDPRSSDFGKIRIGNTRIDLLAGVSQVTVFMARIITGETKNIKTGRITPISGDYIPYGGATTWGVISNFLRTKLTPALGAAITLKQGKDLVGNRVTLYDVPKETVVPLAILDIYQAMAEEGIPMGMALGTLGMFGVGIQTHEQKGARP